MKGRKKHGRKKSREGIFKKKSLYAIVFAVIVLSIVFIYSSQNSPTNRTTNQASHPKAAIVDHLSLTAPNQTFIQTATNTLKQAGYTVDYYPGEQVTVELYRNLPTHEYMLIIFRVHSAVATEWNQLLLFTREPYSTTKYVTEQLTDRVGRAAYNEGDPWYFAIGSKFVTSSMNGRFANTTIIMMGCDGLRITNTAEAFIQKGAKVYIGWNELVQASHTDKATTHLLQHLVIQRQTIEQAVTETMKEVGPDPAYNSLLAYYPLDVGDQTV